MLKRIAAIATVALGFWGGFQAAWGQEANRDSSQPFRPFGGFFRSLVGDPGQSQEEEQLAAPPRQLQSYTRDPVTRRQDSPVRPSERTAPPRAGSLRSESSPAAAYRDVADPPSVVGGRSYEPPRQPLSAPASQPMDQGDYSFRYEEPSPRQNPIGTGRLGRVSNDTPELPGDPPSPAVSTPPATSSGTTSLHQRMSTLRESAFSGDTSASASSSVQETPSDASSQPVVRQADRSSSVGRPAPAVEPIRDQTLPTPSQSEGGLAEQPLEELREQPSPGTEPQRTAERVLSPTSVRSNSEPAADSAVLIARKSPNLSVQTLGPRRVTVGKEAAYEVAIQNSGDVAAEEVIVLVALPEWAEVAGAVASMGEARPTAQGSGQPLQWVVGRIDPRARQKLSLKIIPRQNRPFELAVRWESKPTASQTVIEVQEPRLAMKLDGPREVLFGKREIYKLRLMNSGNGVAENVSLTLSPMTAGQSQPVSHKLGTLSPGEDRTIEIELTARQAGGLTIQVEARGDGCTPAELSEKVVVRRAAIRMDMEGPTRQFVGTSGTYRVRVRNTGDAIAKNVKVDLNLPTGVKPQSGSEGAKLIQGGRVQWTIDRLDPNTERLVAVKCTLTVSGSLRLEGVATADDELTASTETTTQVEALADLRLEVEDPEGPVPVGDEATYVLRVRNRGTKTAQNVDVVVYFSNGVEPSSAEGHAHQLSPGQVLFSPIPSLAPGAEMVLKIRARAQATGNHVFRAEVHCRPLGTRLVREATTHFYQEESAPAQQAARPAPRRNDEPIRDSAVRTADRYPGERE